MILWSFLARHSYQDLIDKVVRIEELAAYAEERLRQLGRALGQDLWVARAPFGLTIRFRQANPEIVFKYSLSGEALYEDDRKKVYSHIFIMDHVTRDLVDALIDDLSQPGAFPEQVESELEAHERRAAEIIKRLHHVPHMGRGFR
jgi:histidine decarboxylase